MDGRKKGRSIVAPQIWNVCCPIIFTIGVIGNILTIIVLNKNSKRSSTTIYLTGLAVADLLLVVTGLPRWWIIYNFRYDIRHYSELACQGQLWSVYAFGSLSSMFLVALTFERILSTVRPYNVRTLCSNRNAFSVSGAVVLFVLLFTAHIFYGFHLDTVTVSLSTSGTNDSSLNTLLVGTNDSFLTSMLPGTNCTAGCDELVRQPNETEDIRTVAIRACTWTRYANYAFFYENVFGQLYMLFYTTIPVFVFSIGGTVLIRRLVLSSRRRRLLMQEGAATSVNKTRTNSWSSQTTQITVMLVTVSVVFFLFTTPSHVFLLGRTTWVDEETGMTETQEIAWAVVNMLTFTNHSINFVLYFLSGARFRKKFFDLVRCWKPAVPLSSLSLSQIATIGGSDLKSVGDLTSRNNGRPSNQF